MRTRFIVYAAFATVVLGGVAAVADALVESDAEHLEGLAADLTELPPGQRVDAVLSWTDPARATVEITVGGRIELYQEDDAALSDDLAEVLAPFTEGELEVVQRSVDVEGDRATVAVRVRGGGSLHDATFHLLRSGQGWLIDRVRAR